MDGRHLVDDHHNDMVSGTWTTIKRDLNDNQFASFYAQVECKKD